MAAGSSNSWGGGGEAVSGFIGARLSRKLALTKSAASRGWKYYGLALMSRQLNRINRVIEAQRGAEDSSIELLMIAQQTNRSV
jgi:hypothetical protein